MGNGTTICSTCKTEAPSQYPHCPFCGTRRPPRESHSSSLVVVLLDRTGSMGPIRDATIAAFNDFLAEQQADPTDCRFTLTLFAGNADDMPGGYKTLHEAQPIINVERLSRRTYRPNGVTPLYDAIGHAVRSAEHANAADPARRVLFVIQTDGQENASKKWKKDSIRKLIAKKQRDGWSFLYFGAELSTYADANAIGIARESTSRFDPTSEGISRSMRNLSEHTSRHRQPHNTTQRTPATPGTRE